MKRCDALVAVAMAALYLALAVGAAGCLSIHAAPVTSAHDHSPSHAAHSALCAWACQANPTVTVLSVAPSAAVLALVSLLLLLSTVLNIRLSASVSRSRAPPR